MVRPTILTHTLCILRAKLAYLQYTITRCVDFGDVLSVFPLIDSTVDGALILDSS